MTMSDIQLDAVTGAFGFSGKYITRRLLEMGHTVRTLTNSPQRVNPFGTRVEIFPYNFDHPDKLADSLRGVSVLYNTYWVRFAHGGISHARAVINSLNLFSAAEQAGIRRIVHISITNPSEDSALPYFHGKARLERGIIESGLSYSILRPAVLFGEEDILINNIAWVLRHLPIFGIFGDGSYRLQPIYVDDLARLAIREGQEQGNHIVDAIGPETFTYRGLVEVESSIIRVKRPIVSVSPVLGYWAGWLIGKLMGDVLVTRDEISGLMQNLLVTNSPPTGETRLTTWAQEHATTLGQRYASELQRHYIR